MHFSFVDRLGISIRCAILYVYLIVSMIALNNTICAILYVFLLYIYAGVYVCMCVYLYVYIYMCVCVYIYVCVGVYVPIHMYNFEEWFFARSLSFLFFSVYLILAYLLFPWKWMFRHLSLPVPSPELGSM